MGFRRQKAPFPVRDKYDSLNIGLCRVEIKSFVPYSRFCALFQSIPSRYNKKLVMSGTVRLSVPAGDRASDAVAIIVPTIDNKNRCGRAVTVLNGDSEEPGSQVRVNQMAAKPTSAMTALPSQERAWPKAV